IDIDESVQFAIRHAVEHPPVCANILRGVRQMDPYVRVALGGDHIAFHLPLRTHDLGNKAPAEKNDD
ncbi:MAG: hypothetical protein DMG72_12225, partial [Acidobacteria bacterium]